VVVDDLLARKAVTREMGSGPLPKVLGDLIDSEFARAHDIWTSDSTREREADQHAVDAFLRKWVSKN
jgi:hypothetical protein